MLAKNLLLVDDKITACVKQIYMFPGCKVVKFRIKKTLNSEHFAFLKNVCYQYLTLICASPVTYCFLTNC